MKKAVLFLLVISVATIYSQEYVNLFKKDLTDRIRFEAFPKQLVNKDLDMAVKIHPELLYYYITYFNLKYDGKVEAEYRLYDKELGEARSSYIKKRNEWFRLGEEQLKVMEKDSAQLEGELQYLSKNNPHKKFLIEHLCDSCYRTDKNRRDYFVYKCYMDDSELMYLPNEDYALLRKEYESKVKSRLEEELKELSNKNLSMSSAEDDYKQLMSFWYLFPVTFEKQPIQAQYTKLIFNSYYKNYQIAEKTTGASENGFAADAGRNYRPGNFKVTLSYNNYFLKSFNYQYDSDIPSEAKLDNKFNFSTGQIFAGFGQTFDLSEGNRMFSKLVLEGGIGFNPAEKTLFLSYPKELPPYTGSDEEELFITNKMVPEKNNLKVQWIFNFSFKAKTPLLYLGDDLSFGIGGVADVFVLQLLTNMDFNLLKVWRGTNYGGQVISYPQRYYYVIVEGEKEVKVFPKFYPIMTAEYKFYGDFSLNCEASLNYYVLGFNYNFLQ